MKASVSPRAYLFAVIGCMAASIFAQAQDIVVQKDNQRREGRILGVAAGNIKIKIGPVETSIPMAQVSSITMAAPQAFDEALGAWQKGDANKTLSFLKPLVDNFQNLPTLWAERASALLPEVYLALDQLPAAETALANFQAAYPQSPFADVGIATLAVAKKDYATAKSKIEPVIAEAEKVLLAEPGKNATYGQAYYLMGIIQEAEGTYPEALRSYLSAATLFCENQTIASKAQKRADFLIKEKQIIVP